MCVGDSVSCASACNTDTTPTQPHRNSNKHRTKNNTTNVVIQQNSCKLLMMDILMSETCWAHKKWNKIARNIWLVVLQLLLPWKSNNHYIFWVCVFSLTYPTCNAHASYYMAICDLSGCRKKFFRLISLTVRFSGKKNFLNTKCVFFYFLYNFCR